MRKLIVSNLISLDGFFDRPGGALDWVILSEEFFDYSADILSAAGSLIFGRLTYDLMLAFWPNAAGEDPRVTEKMNELPKIVFSRTLEKVSWGKWNNVRVCRNAPEEMARLRQVQGGDLLILGSGGLVSSIAPLGLIDEYKLVIQPLVLGKGVPLFGSTPSRINFRLKDSRTLATGVVIQTYIPGENRGLGANLQKTNG
jgi:dihydrofolate reductase